MLAPYSDNNSTRGILTTDPKEMTVIVHKAWEAGWQVVCRFTPRLPFTLIIILNKNIHAIGDKANKIVLNIFESIETTDNDSLRRRRPRIEHAQIMSLEDLERSGRLGGRYFMSHWVQNE